MKPTIIDEYGVMIARSRLCRPEVAAMIQAIHAGELERRGMPRRLPGLAHPDTGQQ
jgi:hypothetical protein